MPLIGCIYIHYSIFSVNHLCYHLSNLIYLYHTEVMVKLYLSKKDFPINNFLQLFSITLYVTFAIFLAFCIILPLCLVVISFIVYFYPKIF